MPVVITCPACQRKARIPRAAVGKTVKCPSCGSNFTAARSDDPPPIPPPEWPEDSSELSSELTPPTDDGRQVERTGVGLLTISQGVFAVSLALQLLITLLGMMTADVAGKSPAQESVSKVVVLIAVLAGVIGTVAALIGTVFCIVPPTYSFARAAAAAVLTLTVLAVVRPPTGPFRDLVSGQAMAAMLSPAVFEATRQALLAIYARIQARRLGDVATGTMALIVGVTYPAVVIGVTMLAILVSMFSTQKHPTFDQVLKIGELLAQTALVAGSAFVLWRVWARLRPA